MTGLSIESETEIGVSSLLRPKEALDGLGSDPRRGGPVLGFECSG